MGSFLIWPKLKFVKSKSNSDNRLADNIVRLVHSAHSVTSCQCGTLWHADFSFQQHLGGEMHLRDGTEM